MERVSLIFLLLLAAATLMLENRSIVCFCRIASTYTLNVGITCVHGSLIILPALVDVVFASTHISKESELFCPEALLYRNYLLRR